MKMKEGIKFLWSPRRSKRSYQNRRCSNGFSGGCFGVYIRHLLYFSLDASMWDFKTNEHSTTRIWVIFVYFSFIKM